MPRRCTICAHPERTAIDQALVAGSMPILKLSALFRVSDDAITRHKAEHLPAKLAKAHQAKEVAHANTLLDEIRALRGKAVGILLTAERAGDLRTALLAIREARSCIELLAEMEGELNRRPEVHVHLSAEWIQIRTVLLHTLAPHPEARVAVARALEEHA